MTRDTVFDREMNVVANKPAHEIKRRFEVGRIPDSWKYVMIGDTKKVVTVSEYANQEKYAEILKVIEEVLERQATRPYKGAGRKLYAERIARKIIDLI